MFLYKVNLCTIGYGLSVGWIASAFLIYNSDDCPLPSGRVEMHEIAWIGSILGIGGLIGTVAVGWIADSIGRKNSMISMAVPQIVNAHEYKISTEQIDAFNFFLFSPYSSVICSLFMHKTFIICTYHDF